MRNATYCLICEHENKKNTEGKNMWLVQKNIYEQAQIIVWRTERYTVSNSSMWIAQGKHASSKNFIFANELHRFIDSTSLFKSSCSNSFGLKKKETERKEGKSCIIIKLLRLTPMPNVITLLVSIWTNLIVDKKREKMCTR